MGLFLSGLFPKPSAAGSSVVPTWLEEDRYPSGWPVGALAGHTGIVS